MFTTTHTRSFRLAPLAVVAFLILAPIAWLTVSWPLAIIAVGIAALAIFDVRIDVETEHTHGVQR